MTSSAPFDGYLSELKQVLQDLLLKWRSGNIDERVVHEEADSWWAKQEWPQYGHDDPRSIVLEVLEQVSILSWQWIVTEDIPAILTFLNTPAGQEKEGWARWQEYWATIDWATRREIVADNPYYSKAGPHSSGE